MHRRVLKGGRQRAVVTLLATRGPVNGFAKRQLYFRRRNKREEERQKKKEGKAFGRVCFEHNCAAAALRCTAVPVARRALRGKTSNFSWRAFLKGPTVVQHHYPVGRTYGMDVRSSLSVSMRRAFRSALIYLSIASPISLFIAVRIAFFFHSVG